MVKVSVVIFIINLNIYPFFLQEYAKKNGEPLATSGKQEKYEAILNFYV